MYIDSSFQIHVSYLDIDEIDQSRDVIYIVDKDLVIKGYNGAWINFAVNNDGRDIMIRFSHGTKITDVISPPLKEYLNESYTRAMDEMKPFEHDYECSSSNIYRKFRQSAYPIINSMGLLITNHIIEEREHDQEITSFTDRFLNQWGMITQCQNCRKTRDPSNEKRWFWVPEIVERPIPMISHSICPFCLDFYYPGLLQDEES